MCEIRLTNSNTMNMTLVSNIFITKYMPSANEAQIKIYLYLLMSVSGSKSVSISDLADTFNLLESDVMRCILYWEKQGLLQTKKDPDGTLIELVFTDSFSGESAVSHNTTVHNTAPMEEKIVALHSVSSHAQSPEEEAFVTKKTVTSSDIKEFKENDSTSQIIFFAQGYLNRPLSMPDIETLIFIYNQLHFSPELIDYLLEYCAGKGKRDIRYIEKVALAWHKENITNVEEAKNNISKYPRIVYDVMKALGRSSMPTDAEAGYVHKWTNTYGFADDVILYACTKSAVNTTNGRFQYADGILTSWHTNGLHSMKQIQDAEAAYQKAHPNSDASAKAASKSKNAFNNFEQRDYDFSKLEKKLLGQ